MADKRISQLIERTDIANNDVLPIVASGASTTNKVTISTIQDWMQDNLDVGVTSVGITIGSTGTDINVTGSPITTSGNITINIPTASATNRGLLSSSDWTSFNSKLSSVGLTMPSAFTVSNSPLTANGTIAVTGAGTVAQYIRGDGSLADFPQGGGGGGASVSYYLNGSVSQGTIGGIAYREMNKTPILGSGTDFTINANGYIASFITDAGDPNLLLIPGGNWNLETYFAASSGGGSPSFYVELYKVDSGGTATLVASNSANPELIAFGTTTTAYFSSLAVPATVLTLTDRLALRYYVTHAGRTITLHTENSNLCQIITTFTTGLTALNGLTAQVQNFATGTSGTDFNISSASTTHTFNLPDASASNRGAVTTGSQVFGGVKTFSNGFILPSAGGTNQNSRFVNIGTIHEGSAGSTQIGFNNSNNIYFGKGLSNGGVIQWTNSAVRYYTLPDADGTLALTSDLGNYIQGSGTADSIPKFTGTRTIANSAIRDTTSTVVISKNVSVDNGASQAINLTPASGGTTNRIETTGTLPLSLVTSGASITLAAGGVTPQITLSSAGLVTLTGALNGTSASFTGAVNSQTLVIKNSGVPAAQFFRDLDVTVVGSAGQGIEFGARSSSTFIAGAAIYGGLDNPATTGNLVFQTLTGGTLTTKLTIASTGAATFSSSVTATSFNLGNGQFLRLTRNSGGLQYDALGIVAGTDNTRLISTGDFDVVNGSLTSQFKITANGNVGINTTSPANILSVRQSNTSTATILELTNTSNGSNTTKSSRLLFGLADTVGTVKDAAYIESMPSSGLPNVQNAELVFGTRNSDAAPTERMRITSVGNVGIGTASPAYLLDIQSTSATLRIRNITAPATGGTSSLLFEGINNFSGTSQSFINSIQAGNSGSTQLVFGTSGTSDATATERMRITSGGAVQIGTRSDATESTANLTLNNTNYGAFHWLDGTAYYIGQNSNFRSVRIYSGSSSGTGVNLAAGATSWGTYSDERLKENIENIDSVLPKLSNLRTVKYHLKNIDTEDSKKRLGLIAQDLVGNFDEVLSESRYSDEDETEYYDVRYTELIPVLIKAIQEQQEQIDSLKNQIK